MKKVIKCTVQVDVTPTPCDSPIVEVGCDLQQSLENLG